MRSDATPTAGSVQVFAFSVDNWQRPAAEVRILLELMARVLQTELPQLQRAGVRLHVLGDLSRLPASFRAQLQRAVEATAGNSTLQLSVAISYSGRASLVVAARSLAAAAAAGELDAACIDAAAVAAALGTAHLPPQLREPDLLVRTSGERRLSDFLLWELAYTELYFTHVHWPAFGAAELAAALQDYAGRSRRFGTH
jgi:undecaprenyl diphosphate synthase